MGFIEISLASLFTSFGGFSKIPSMHIFFLLSATSQKELYSERRKEFIILEEKVFFQRGTNTIIWLRGFIPLNNYLATTLCIQKVHICRFFFCVFND